MLSTIVRVAVVDVFVEPYIFIGFLQHLTYWDRSPGDAREWESEKIVAWVTDLAAVERERKAAESPETPAEGLPDGAGEPESQPLPTPGTVTRDSDLGAFLESHGLVPPGVFEPQYSAVPGPIEEPSTDVVPETSQR